MMMSRSEAQQTTSPLFVDKEDDLEDVENVVIDTALPFDKCLSIDKQCEKEENIDKKNREMLEYRHKLGDVKTTLKDSKKQIDNWFGKEILFNIGNNKNQYITIDENGDLHILITGDKKLVPDGFTQPNLIPISEVIEDENC